MKNKEKDIIKAMLDEICDSLENFENNSSKKLADYKELVEDIKSSVEICKEELENKNNEEYSKEISKSYEKRYLPANPYERAKVVLRRLKNDQAKLDKFLLTNEGKNIKDCVFVGITKDELVNIKKDIKFLNNLFQSDLKDYELPYTEIFKNGMSLSEYSKKYLDGKKKTAENLVNKIYKMVAQEYLVESNLFSYKFALPIFKSKRNKRLAEMESELLCNIILDLEVNDKPDRYFQDMKWAYTELARVSEIMDDDGNF